jgi:hypothetical protein
MTDVLEDWSTEAIFAFSEMLNLKTRNIALKASCRCLGSARSNPSLGYRLIVGDSVTFSPCSNCCRNFVENWP